MLDIDAVEPSLHRTPWNKGRLIGQKRPLKPKEVWAIRVRLQLEQRRRDLTMADPERSRIMLSRPFIAPVTFSR